MMINQLLSILPVISEHVVFVTESSGGVMTSKPLIGKKPNHLHYLREEEKEYILAINTHCWLDY